MYKYTLVTMMTYCKRQNKTLSNYNIKSIACFISLILAEEAHLPSGISAKRIDPRSYAPGQLIVELKESKTTADFCKELNQI